MQLIYTTQTTGFEPHKHYRNPLYFEKAESKVTDVVIYGDFPKIAQAYQSLGVKVQWVDEQSDKKPLDKMTVPELTTALKALNVEIPQDTIRHNKFYFINVSKLNAVCFCKTACAIVTNLR
ncbi:hypothetical protein, partial [Glaesserella parasuis]